MGKERKSKNSHLELITGTFSSRKKEEEKQSLLSQFQEKIMEIIWTYSPNVKVKDYSRNYSYSYLEPGIDLTPPVPFNTSAGKIQIHVEGVFKKDNTPNIHPDSVEPIKLGIYFNKGHKNSSLVIQYGNNTKPIERNLPSLEELKKGIEILDYLAEQYQKLGTKKAPTGGCSDHP